MERFDVAVVGGGIVGLSIARQLCLEGFSVVVFEKEKECLLGASGANSSLLHCGFDANPDFLESRLVREGFALWVPLCEKMGVVRKSGGLVVAWSDEEVKQLPKLLEKAKQNKCFDAVVLDKAETYARCGSLAAGVKGEATTIIRLSSVLKNKRIVVCST
jgi:glycerol-3-phosphate dehydrogenase